MHINFGSLVVLSLLLTPSLMASPEGAFIRSVKYSGTGCPPNTANPTIVLEPELGVVLTPETLSAELGPGIARPQSRKNCNITLDVGVPEGWQFALASFNASGVAKLEAGVRGELVVQYFFEGGVIQRLNHRFEGPFHEDFRTQDLLPFRPQIWSDCSAPKRLSVNTSLRVSLPAPAANPAASGWVELGSHWESNTMDIQLVWRPCNTSS